MYIFDTIMNRLRRGCQTFPYPKGQAPALPDRPLAEALETATSVGFAGLGGDLAATGLRPGGAVT